MKEISLRLCSMNSTVLVGSDLLAKVSDRVKDFINDRNIALITDTGVPDAVVNQVRYALQPLAKAVYLTHLQQGESSKKIETVLSLARKLLNWGFDRSDLVVGLGGGSVLDTAGFLSAIYMRGLPYMNIPTTALAQADACIGGKVAVNFEGGKNLLGSFYHPTLVLVDPDLLKTQTIQERKAGLVEVIKAGIIGDKALFSIMEQSLEPIASLKDMALMEQSISRALEVKARIVMDDERESGARMKLNLGHTVAHALESITAPGGLNHGEAVAIGIIVAANIAKRRDIIPNEDFNRIVHLLRSLGLPKRCPSIDSTLVVVKTALDKKRRQGRLHFVLPSCVGNVEVVNDVGPYELLEGMEDLKSSGLWDF